MMRTIFDITMCLDVEDVGGISASEEAISRSVKIAIEKICKDEVIKVLQIDVEKSHRREVQEK